MTMEQLEKRVDLLEKHVSLIQRVIVALGELLVKHLPSMYVDLSVIGAEWKAEEEKINEEQK